MDSFLGFTRKMLIWMKPWAQNRRQEWWQNVSWFALDMGKAASLDHLTWRSHTKHEDIFFSHSPSVFKIKPSNSLPQMGDDNHLSSILGYWGSECCFTLYHRCSTRWRWKAAHETKAGTDQDVSKLRPACVFMQLLEFFRFKVCARSQVVSLWIYWATNEIFLNLSKSWNWSESSGESFYEKPAFFFFLSLIGNISHVTLITPLGEQKTKTLPAKLIPFWDLDLSDMCICKLHHSSIPDQKH